MFPVNQYIREGKIITAQMLNLWRLPAGVFFFGKLESKVSAIPGLRILSQVYMRRPALSDPSWPFSGGSGLQLLDRTRKSPGLGTKPRLKKMIFWLC